MKSGLSRSELDALLVATADDQTSLKIVGSEVDWIYAPYDGGADVLAPDRIERDALRDGFSGWLSGRVDGL